jgi:DNA mismatch repair ATPase MutS
MIFFKDNKNYREKFQLILKKLDRKNAFYIPDLLYSELPERPKFYYMFYLLSALAFVLLPLMFIYHTLIWFAGAVFITNLVIEHIYERKVDAYSGDLSMLSAMLRCSLNISGLEPQAKQIETLRASEALASKLLKKIGWMTIDKNQLDEVSAIVIEYLNHFCLFNLVAFIRAIHLLKQYQEELKTIYQSVASLDAEIAVASYLYENKNYCNPLFNQSATIRFEDVYHPLLEDAVANSIDLENRSCLVTGSNMAGKTTFIKTIGINVILAQSLYFTHAKQANIPRLHVRSTIKRSDNIAEHKSYYFKEIEAILDFIQREESPLPYLFLIDEIFRGTNTVERISAATSVLRYLSKYSFTLVTTHDIELQELLKENFDMYHFSEQVDDGRFYFDYKIKPGPCSTRNAIKLLELKGYPKEITDEAIEISKSVSTQVSV